MSKTKKQKTYTVWIEQVNASRFDVMANDMESARDEAKRVWRRDYAYPTISCIEEKPKEWKP